MATTEWTGTAGDGDWSNAANWSGVVPVSNDDVIVNATADDITTGMAQGAVDLDSLYIGPNFRGTIGTSGTPLTIAVSGAADSILVYASGGGDSFITAGTNNIDVASIEHVTKSTFHATGGTYTRLDTANAAGPIEINGSCTVTTLNHTSRDSLGVKASSGTTLTTVNHEGTYMQSAADIVTGHIQGRVRLTGTAKFSTLGRINNGGTYEKHSSGTDATVRVAKGGTFTPAGSVAGDYTITTFQEVEGSNVTKDAPGVAGTFSTRTIIGGSSSS